MALTQKHIRWLTRAGILLSLAASLLLNAMPALAMKKQDAAALPNFSEFVQSVHTGEENVVRGVYVPNVMAYRVAQQPLDNPGFLSSKEDRVTQFRMAAGYGTVGLVAHNYLAGESFFNLEAGDEVRIVYGDSKVETFVVYEILQYQALQPNSPYSSFQNLDRDETLTVNQMFKRVFVSDGYVTFQTCIEKDGISTWGRLFVIAIPKAEYEELWEANGL
ncbi:MAG: hypothetical protein CNIPEHKO_03186 [Anaerolineales bacterium]|nr:hypothetical protein [Anaerolineae bacterium]MBL8104938.1 hypothetical protein [Anaerolineales bacterium]MBV6402870.1 hypothetical protein [Anaerolineales bacterium]MCC7189440.1 hypothetical protein [Anaerolineales bacterium]